MEIKEMTGNPEPEGGADSMTIEEMLDQLEGLLEQMENRDSSLEETFACYEKGMKLAKACSGKIDKVEKKIQILSEEGQDGEF